MACVGFLAYVDDVLWDLNRSDNNVTACHYSDGRLSEKFFADAYDLTKGSAHKKKRRKR
jgi:hypothetical protein